MNTEVLFTKLDSRALPPRNAYGDDAGWDLFSLEDTILAPWPHLTWVRTGIAVALPAGFYGRIIGRSSATSKGLHVVEGTIDCGYRGEQMARVSPVWLADAPDVPPAERTSPVRKVSAGESIIQLVVQRAEPVQFVEVETLPESVRGLNGYGSSDRMLVYREKNLFHLPGSTMGMLHTACGLNASLMVRERRPIEHAGLWCTACAKASTERKAL